MINNNFGNLVGSISQLNDRARTPTVSSSIAQPNFSLDYGEVTVNFSDNTGLSSAFQGFEGALGNRYSMNDQETLQLLQMFTLVLSELMDAVVSNSSANQNSNGGQSTRTTSNNTTSNVTANNATSSVDAAAEIVQSEENAGVHAKGSCPFTAMKESEGA